MIKEVKEFLFIILVGLIHIGGLIILYISRQSLGFNNLILAISGLIIGFTGIFVWITGFISLGKAFYILPRPLKLKTTGIYKFIAHPIYVGIGLVFIGFSITIGSVFGLIYTLAIIIPFDFLRARIETGYLNKLRR